MNDVSAKSVGPGALLLVLASIAVLDIYVHHIGQALRVSALIELVGDDTRKLVDRRYPDGGEPPPVDPDAPRVVAARGVAGGLARVRRRSRAAAPRGREGRIAPGVHTV